jgi:hypothetical protein
MAQFIDPVTPDIAASCLSASVRNTGTSAFGDLQAVVVDGSDPSIIFIDYSTGPPTEFCFPIQAFAQGASVSDPDVVWDYSGSGLLLVVYESNIGPSGIWSEMWDWNGGSPTPVTGYGTGGFFNFSTGATYPNVDADVVGNAVVVWERAGDIEAMTVDFPTLAPSGNTCLVNVGGCGINSSVEPDVAIRYFNGNSFVDFVMVDQGTPSGEIKTVFEKFTNVQNGFVTCIIHTVQHAGGIVPTRVAKPRIDMNTYFNSYWAPFHDPFSCSVVYELIDGASNYIGSSQLMDITGTSFPLPQPPNVTANIVFEQTYTQPVWPTNEWISDVLNNDLLLTPTGVLNSWLPVGSNTQINQPSENLEMYLNRSPVTTHAEMIVYTGWNWQNSGGIPIRPGNVEEVLSRRLVLTPNGDFINAPIPSAVNNTRYEFVIPAPTNRDYFAIGEAFLQIDPQSVISMDGAQEYVYYAFVGTVSNRIYYKRSFVGPTNAVRIGKLESPRQASVTANKELSIYPNPSIGHVVIKAPQAISRIQLIGMKGELLLEKELGIASSNSDLDLSLMPNGVYTISIHYNNATPDFKRIVIAK